MIKPCDVFKKRGERGLAPAALKIAPYKPDWLSLLVRNLSNSIHIFGFNFDLAYLL
jgi:hypothetical protein